MTLEDVDDEQMAVRRNFLELDPPRHTAVRQLLAKDFTPRALSRYEDLCRAIARHAIDEAAADERAGLRRAHRGAGADPRARPHHGRARRAPRAADRALRPPDLEPGPRDRERHGRLARERGLPPGAVPQPRRGGALRARPRALRGAARGAAAGRDDDLRPRRDRRLPDEPAEPRQQLRDDDRGRQRDDAPGDGARDARADRAPRPARAAAPRPVAHADRGRGADPLRRRRCTTSAARRRARPSCTARRSARATRSCSGSRRPTATPTPSPTRSASTSRASPTTTPRSAAAGRTSASARTSRGSRSGSCSRSCCRACASIELAGLAGAGTLELRERRQAHAGAHHLEGSCMSETGLEAARAAGARIVRVTYADLHGIMRGKAFPIDAFETAADDGVGFCKAISNTDLRHNVTGGFDHGLQDILVPAAAGHAARSSPGRRRRPGAWASRSAGRSTPRTSRTRAGCWGAPSPRSASSACVPSWGRSSSSTCALRTRPRRPAGGATSSSPPASTRSAPTPTRAAWSRRSCSAAPTRTSA